MSSGAPLPPIGDDDLHAYIDRRLPPERRAEVERRVAGNPEIAARVAFYTRLNVELHNRFDHVLAEPVPADWMPKSLWTRLWRKPALRQSALAASLLLVGAIGGWAANEALIPPTVVERLVEERAPLTVQAAVAHAVFSPEMRHPVEVSFEERDHLTRWLSYRMKQPIKAPDLDGMGWRLMGGRLLPVPEDSAQGGHVASQFMFENTNGDRVTLYIKPLDDTSSPASFRYASEMNGISVFYWLDTKLGYALSGKLPKEDMRKIAWTIYAQFNP